MSNRDNNKCRGIAIHLVWLVLLGLLWAGSSEAAFDSSDYRQNTYGRVPDRYCDPTKSLGDSSGNGLSEGTAWNMNQCMTQPSVSGFPSPGVIVGIMPVGAGTPVRLADPTESNVPSFNPTNQGTSNTARIIYVAKRAAVALAMADRATIASNQNRSEIRFTTTTDQFEYNASPTGPVYGSYQRNYITYDGLFVDMAQNGFHNDSGVIRADGGSGSTYILGIQFKNFVIKGKTTDCDSNCILYRPNFASDMVLSNFLVYDYDNQPVNHGVGDELNQQGLFSDQYSDHNFLIEHFWLDNVDQSGIFVKGSADNSHNWGTIRYGKVTRTSRCFMFNDQHPTNLTTIEYNLCDQNNWDGAGGGIEFHAITQATQNILVHHNTIARVGAVGIDTKGCIFNDKPLGFASANNVTIRDNLCDVDNGTFGHEISICCSAVLPTVLNYNTYYKNGGTESYTFNNVQYNSFPSWQAAISGRDANSLELSTSPFVNRSSGDLHVSAGHPAKTASSTGGEVGVYATNEVIGPDVTDSVAPSRFNLNLSLRRAS